MMSQLSRVPRVIYVWPMCLIGHLAFMFLLDHAIRTFAGHGTDLPTLVTNSLWFMSSFFFSLLAFLGSKTRFGNSLFVAGVALSTVVFLFAGFLMTIRF